MLIQTRRLAEYIYSSGLAPETSSLEWFCTFLVFGLSQKSSSAMHKQKWDTTSPKMLYAGTKVAELALTEHMTMVLGASPTYTHGAPRVLVSSSNSEIPQTSPGFSRIFQKFTEFAQIPLKLKSPEISENRGGGKGIHVISHCQC